MRITKFKYILFYLALFSICFLLIEFISYLGVLYLQKVKSIYYEPIQKITISEKHKEKITELLNQDNRYTQYDKDLGWSIKPNSTSGIYTSNRQGIRANLEYNQIPNQNKIRIAAFGDSFTHSDEVDNQDMWTAQLQNKDLNLEVLNFGVGGYGLDQAFIRYTQMGQDFSPNIVLIGFTPYNTFRHVNVYRPFYNQITAVPLSKPRFILDNENLILLKNPIQDINDYKKILDGNQTFLKQLGKYDFYYNRHYHDGRFDNLSMIQLYKIFKQQLKNKYLVRDEVLVNNRYNPNSEAFKVSISIFWEFYLTAIKNNSIPIIVIFPSTHNFEHNNEFSFKNYHYFLNFFKEAGFNYIDLTNTFIQFQEGRSYTDFFNRTHYSPLGNKITAEAIYEKIKKEGLLNKDNLEEKNKELIKLHENFISHSSSR